MKSLRLFFILAISAMMMVSCHKTEGDDVPTVDKAIVIDLDSLTVFSLRTESESGALLEKAVLYYAEVVEMNDSVMKVDSIEEVSWQNVVLTKEAPFKDTLWKMKPHTLYAYWVYMEDFASSKTTDTTTVTTWSPTLPTVNADSALMVNDTLRFYGSVNSCWRALMDEQGVGAELRFYWGTTEESVNNTMTAASVVKDTLVDEELRLVVTGSVTREEFPDATKIYYKAYAKHAWGDGERYSNLKNVSVAPPSKAE